MDVHTGITKVLGYLEIDHKRGVIYFHRYDTSDKPPTLLRICRLHNIPPNIEHIDLTHMIGINYYPEPL